MRDIVKKQLAQIHKYYSGCKDQIDNGKSVYVDDLMNFLNKQITIFTKDINSFNKTSNTELITPQLLNLAAIYYLLDESSYEFSNQLILDDPTRTHQWQNEARIRLTLLFLNRLAEAIYLLQGGFASAAIARARGMYEVAVFMEIILSHDEDLAEKFLKYCNVESDTILNKLIESQPAKFKNKIGLEVQSIPTEIKYGKNFSKPYGWAHGLVKGCYITFNKLAKTTSLYSLHGLYSMCCPSSHASIFDSIGGIGLNKSERGKSIWKTGGSSDGVSNAIDIIEQFICHIIPNISGPPDSMFIILFLSNSMDIEKNTTNKSSNNPSSENFPT